MPLFPLFVPSEEKSNRGRFLFKQRNYVEVGLLDNDVHLIRGREKGPVTINEIQSEVRRKLVMQRADEKNRRDYFFCQLARLNFEGQSDTDGWVAVSQLALKTGYGEDVIRDFLERLIEDGWIEVKNSINSTKNSARLTLIGKSRAQVICKDASLA